MCGSAILTNMPELTKKEIEQKDFVVVKDRNTQAISKIVAPHSFQIGIEGFKNNGSGLLVKGNETVEGSLTVVGGIKGALKLPDGTLTLRSGNGVDVSYNQNSTVSLSLADDCILKTLSVAPLGGLIKTVSSGAISLSINSSTFPDFTGPVKFNQGLSGSLTKLADGSSYLNAGSGVTILTASNGSITISATGGGGDFVEYTFPDNLIVSLPNGKTFGRYASGDTIPATGKTPAEVIQLAIAEPIDPTATLASSTSVAFNQTSISNVLNFGYTINTLGATCTSAILSWRRAGAGSWSTLSTSTSSSLSFTHTLTDTSYNSSAFNYSYVVTDSAGASSTALFNIIPASYVNPSVSLTVVAASAASPETNTKREKGNINTNLGGSITKNSTNVSLVSYTLQYSTNNATWIDIGQSVAIGPDTSAIASANHNDASLKTASTIYYRVKVIDSYQVYLSSAGVTGGNSSVSFLNFVFYGVSANAPANSAGVRALTTKIFSDGNNPFNLNTGTTSKIFTVAMPATFSITSVIDSDALNANITANYALSTFGVNDAGGTTVSYKVYTMTNAEPYTPTSHNHQVTRA